MDFLSELEKLNIKLSDEMKNQFEKFFIELKKTNENVNLTAITDKDEVYFKHFFDSLTLAKDIDSSTEITILDVGSGAGFPGIPLAIVYPYIKIYMIDSTKKKIDFIESVCEKLELKNVKAVHARAEEYITENRERFDIVTARAVARLNILAELCLPFVKVGGEFIAMKGSDGISEVNEAKNAIGVLGGKVKEVREVTLPNEYGKRTIITVNKSKVTDIKYPRKYSIIKSKPL